MPEPLFNTIIVLVLILLNGIFALSELAIVSARRTRLRQMAEQGVRGAGVALELAESPNRFLSTVQVGITLVGIFAGAFGGATIAGPLATLLEPLPFIGTHSEGISLALVVTLITFLSVVIGELVPKRIALYSAERIAALVARPMQMLSVIATPIVRLLSAATDAVLGLLGMGASTPEEVTEEEIRMLVQEGAQAGIIEEAERDMVEGVFRLNDRPLEVLMTPRTEIVWLDARAPTPELRQIMAHTGHARFPVCAGTLDQVLGIVRAKDVLADCLAERDFDPARSAREPLYLPGTMRALRALERFKQAGTHMALVVDEFGGVDGLVTLIDILEAIVGDIPTPEELEDPAIVQREDGSWLVDGLLPIDEFKPHFGLKMLPGEDAYQTVGGFLIYMLGDLPEAGNRVTWNEMRFEIVDMDGLRVDKVLVEMMPPEALAEEEEEGGE